MTRLLALTLLIGFFAFLPSAFANGENGLHIIPADVHQSASSGAAMLTLNATNIQVRAKWRLDGDSPFAITDNGELRLTAELSDPTTIVATVIVEDMFSELNSNYQNLAATALITVEFMFGTLRIVNPPARLLAASGMGGTMAFQTSGGMGERVFRLYSASDYFTLGETSGILSVAASVAVGQYAITVEVRDETATLFITIITEVEAADNLILANAPPLAATVIVGIALSLHTFTASGGLGTLTYALIGNHAGHFSIDERDGVLRIHGDTEVGIYMLSVEVSDGLIIPQRATAMATVKIKERKLNALYLAAKVSDNPIILHAFTLQYANTYAIAAGNDSGHFAISEIGGTLWALENVPEGAYTLSIEITYQYSAGIPPTKLISLVVVEMSFAPPPIKSQIFVLGGSLGGNNGSKNDVWSSGNGINWTMKTANAMRWSGGYDDQAIAHNGKIYVLGGGSKNDIWSSGNGRNWTLETGNSGWSGRHNHQAVAHNGKIYVLGGSVSSDYYNDVWSSGNGVNWTMETGNAGWPGRYWHQAIVHNNKIYVLGGSHSDYYNDDYYNDVWSSGNGVDWTRKTGNAGWSRRYGHQAVVHNGKIYVLGGYYSNGSKNDVWSSGNGVDWTMKTANAEWSGRAGHQAIVHNDKIYVLGGVLGGNNSSKNDVWSSGNGVNWTIETASAGWSGRFGHQAVLFPPSLAWLALPDTDEFIFPFGESVIIHTFDAQYGDGNYTYKLLPDISGFSLSTNGELSTDGTAATGEHTITVQVADGDGQATTWTGKVIIICPGCKKQ